MATQSLTIDKPIGYGKKYLQDLYDSENHPKDIPIEAEKELDEDDKGPTILKSELVKAIKDMQRKMETRDDNIPRNWMKMTKDPIYLKVRQ